MRLTNGEKNALRTIAAGSLHGVRSATIGNLVAKGLVRAWSRDGSRIAGRNRWTVATVITDCALSPLGRVIVETL